nr:hypothetical protein CJLB15_00039 [Campylobacter phage CJLB-15]
MDRLGLSITSHSIILRLQIGLINSKHKSKDNIVPEFQLVDLNKSIPKLKMHNFYLYFQTVILQR